MRKRVLAFAQQRVCGGATSSRLRNEKPHLPRRHPTEHRRTAFSAAANESPVQKLTALQGGQALMHCAARIHFTKSFRKILKV